MGRKSLFTPPKPVDFESMHSPSKIGVEHFLQICTWFNNGINTLSIVHKLRCTHGWHIMGTSLSKPDVYSVLIYAAKLGLINTKYLTNYVEQKQSRINKHGIRRLPAELGATKSTEPTQPTEPHSALYYFQLQDNEGGVGCGYDNEEDDRANRQGSSKTIYPANCMLEHFYNALSLYRAGFTPTQIYDFSFSFPDVRLQSGSYSPNSNDIKGMLVRLAATRRIKSVKSNIDNTDAGGNVGTQNVAHTFNELLENNGFLKPRRYLHLYPLPNEELTDEMLYDLELICDFLDNISKPPFNKKYNATCLSMIETAAYTELLKSSSFVFNGTLYPGFRRSSESLVFNKAKYISKLPDFDKENERLVSEIKEKQELITKKLKEDKEKPTPYQSMLEKQTLKSKSKTMQSVIDQLHNELGKEHQEVEYEPVDNPGIAVPLALKENTATEKEGEHEPNLVKRNLKKLKLIQYLNGTAIPKEEQTISKVVTDITAGVQDALDGF